MGFYGNIKDVEKNSSFVFDKIYANRKQMEEKGSQDGVYIGRYVLIEYDTVATNLDYRKAYYKDGDSTFQTYNVLYTSGEYEAETRIIYEDATETDNKISLNTLVYSTEKEQNSYFQCVGYITFSHDEDKDTYSYTITVPNKSASSITVTTNARNYVENQGYVVNRNYAIFEKMADSSIDAYNNYALNYNTDIAWAKSKNITITGHGWDSTVWQKTVVSGAEKYVMIAELNTVVPSFGITADAPTQTPLTPHFDANSTDIYYTLHWQPQWGMRVQLADATHSDGEEQVLSDATTTWIRQIYDKNTDKTTSYYFTKDKKWKQFTNVSQIGDDGKLPAAIYYNKAGFNPVSRYHSTIEDKFSIEPTGYSQTPNAQGNWENTQYNSHKGAGLTESAVDTQEISMVLPSIGNAISEMWDIVYGNGDGLDDSVSGRSTDIGWRDTPVLTTGNRLQLIQTEDNKSYSYQKTDVETLAGSINSVHDLMGMIIQEPEIEDTTETGLTDFAKNRADNDSIYYINNKFYRKASYDDITPLTSDEYKYETKTGLTPNTYNTWTYYIYDSTTQTYKEATGEYDSSETYYIKLVDGGMEEVEISTFESIMSGKDYYYKTANEDYIYSNTYSKDKQYYYFTANPTSVTLATDYQPNKYYYASGYNYILDTSKEAATAAFEYEIDPTVLQYSRSVSQVYRSGAFYSLVNGESDNYYKIDRTGYTANKQYYNIARAVDKADVDAILGTNSKKQVLVYQLRNEQQVTQYILGAWRKMYTAYTVSDSGTLTDSISDVWLDESGTENKYYTGTTEDTKTEISQDNKVFTPVNKYVYDEAEQLYYIYNGQGRGIEYQNEGNKDAFFYGLNPESASQASINYLYILTPVTLYDGVFGSDGSKSGNTIYYQFVDNNYIRINNQGELEKLNSDTLVYVLSFTIYNKNAFYQPNKYYYQTTKSKSWQRDSQTFATEGREYYAIDSTIVAEADIDLTKKYLYEPGKYYYQKNNRYYIDNNPIATENRTYYIGLDDFYVAEDGNNALTRGAHWNSALPVIHNLSLGKKSGTAYVMKELVGFARTLNTIHGLILQINNFLEYGNEDTRNTSTVQGVVNTLNDIIAKFELLDYGQFVVTDGYGRAHTAPAAQDNWIETYVEPKIDNPIVHVHHLFNKEDDTASDIDLNTAEEKNTIALYEPMPDETGHITYKNIRTVTLPYGFKTLVDDNNDEYVAKNTQDSFRISSKDKWLETEISDDGISIEHTYNKQDEQTSELDLNTATEKNKIITIDPIIDATGHVVSKDTKTVTLPYGFKIIGSDSGSYTAVNTQDTISITASDQWLDTKISGNTLDITHKFVPDILEASVQDKHAPENNTITVATHSFDDTGHKNASNTETITLPWRFKQVTGDTGTFIVKEGQTFAITTSDDWLTTSANTDSGIIVVHNDAQKVKTTKGLTQAATPNFGDSFVVPEIGIDDKGHTASLTEYSVTLPKVTITPAETGNVVTGITINSTSGVITETKTNAGDIALGTYTTEVSNDDLVNTDTISNAFNKLAARLTTEVTNRASADTKVREDFASADDTVRGEFAAADTSLKTTLEAADSNLSSRITELENLNIKSTYATITTVNSLTNRVNTLEGYDIPNTYLSSSTAASTYLTKSDASSTYLTIPSFGDSYVLKSVYDALEKRVAALEETVEKLTSSSESETTT